ncbi:MAG: hypothetical protein H7X94_05620 [Vallitaleaceae bacterium]|nr:hypothetical protein [Vallitaleaceae bacterium]
MMEIRDDVIIDGNAVYEIDPNCSTEIRSAQRTPDSNNFLPRLFILAVFFLKA